VFDTIFQNEVCVGPNPCIFRGVSVNAGEMAFASGALNDCPSGCPDPNQPPPQNQQIFRVAQVGFCATAPGQATIHWQFAPPAPVTRDTEIVDVIGNIVSNRACYVDYVINIVPSPT